MLGRAALFCKKRCDHARVRRVTMRRVMGASTRTAGKATAQLVAQTVAQCPGNAASSPRARAVAIPDTIADISPDRIRPKRMGAKRGESSLRLLPGASGQAHLDPFISGSCQPLNNPAHHLLRGNPGGTWPQGEGGPKAPGVLLQKLRRWDDGEKRAAGPKAKPVRAAHLVMCPKIDQTVKRLSVNQRLQPGADHDIR
jgi:hypothetical protein